jgi:hypothetical protein
MSVTLAPELGEAIKESADRQGLSLDNRIVAAAELKFPADDEAAILGERMTGLGHSARRLASRPRPSAAE